MRRAAWWVVGAGCAGMVLVGRTNLLAAEAKAQQGAAQPPAAQAAKPVESQSAASTSEEKIIYTFENDDKMKEFGKLWQQRQGIIVRMSVLQAYWNEEQANLGEINKKLESDYKLDPTKNYALDAKRRVIIERGKAPMPETPAQSQAPSKTQ